MIKGSANKGKRLKLKGEELGFAKRVADEVRAGLSLLDDLASRSGRTGKKGGGRRAIVEFADGGGHFKVIYSDEAGNCLAVMEDPPGVTRPCTFEESTTCHEIPKLLKA
jgi:hypothetical protein